MDLYLFAMFDEYTSPKEILKKIASGALGLFVSLLVMMLLVYLVSLTMGTGGKKDVTPLLSPKSQEEVNFKDADVIFQQSSGELSEKIKAITGSPLTHCGMIVIRDENIMVLEAGEKVVFTPVKDWVHKGIDKRFLLMRSISLNDDKIADCVREGIKFKGKPYDYAYDWDDAHIYCSELIYKSYFNGAQIKLCPFVKLGELKYQGHEDFIKNLMKGELPLDKKLITPVDLSVSEELKVIYNDFNNK